MPCQFPGCVFPTPTNVCFRHASKVYELVTVKPVLIPLPELLETAQRKFNTWIRNRDKNAGCISCGSQITDAGHYIPVGENSALRFTETNAWGQCKTCNIFKIGNREVYRVELIKMVGINEVIRLETFPKFNKWQREAVNEIIEYYSILNK